jgi:hypothetical protein
VEAAVAAGRTNGERLGVRENGVHPRLPVFIGGLGAVARGLSLPVTLVEPAPGGAEE